jgi:hypothetical protein
MEEILMVIVTQIKKKDGNKYEEDSLVLDS